MQSFDATAILFADPADTTPAPDFDNLTLAEQIDYAKWQVTVAQEYLADLLRKQAEYDAHIDDQYKSHLEIEYGRICCESDRLDKEVSRC